MVTTADPSSSLPASDAESAAQVIRPALSSRRLAAGLALGVLGLGLLVTALSVHWAHSRIQTEAQLRFDNHAARVHEAVQRQFRRAESGFYSVRGFIQASRSHPDREAMRVWVASHDMSAEFPGVRGLGYIQRVPRLELPAFIAAERADRAPDFAVRTAGNAPDLYVIRHVEPHRHNREARGLDIGSEPRRREAADRAARTNRPALTAPIVLVQDGQKRPGFLYLLPHYRGLPDPEQATPEQRMAALHGWVYAPIVLAELVVEVEHAADRLLDFEVFDDAAAGPSAAPLYDHDSKPVCARQLPTRGGAAAAVAAGTPCEPRVFATTRLVDVGGRTLRLAISGTRAFDATLDRSPVHWLAVGGTLMSVLLSALVWILGSGRARSVALAELMTQDLRRATEQAQTALRDSTSLLSALHQHAIVSVTDRHGLITEVNDAFCRISGYRRDELVGRNHRVIKSGEHPDTFWPAVWRQICRGRPWRGEVCNRAKDGSLYWVDTFITPFMGADGKVEKYISMRVDITAAKASARELETTTKRFEVAIEGAAEGLWEWMDVHRPEQWWSPQFYRLLGHEVSDIAPSRQAFDDLVHPDQRAAVGEAMQAALDGRALYDMAFKLRTRSGEYRWYRSRAKVWCDREGRPVSMAGSLQDVHERRLALDQVRERNAQLDAVFTLSPDAFVSFGADRCVNLVSPPFTALTGIAADDVIGLDATRLLERLRACCAPDTPLGPLHELLTDRPEPSDRPRLRVLLELQQPMRRVLQCSLHAGSSSRTMALLHLHDVTHETEVERLKSEFLSMAAHELRTPMSSILGFTELLMMRAMPPERQREMLAAIHRNSLTMTELINELLDLARIEAGQGTDFRIEAVELNELARGALEDFQAPAGRTPPRLVSSGAALWAQADRAKLRQAVFNLLSNGYKYSQADSPVELCVLHDSATARHGLRVVDQGIGMSEEQLAHVGERFYRADQTGNIPGTGLGISIVKETLKLLGGSLSITSREGVGTEVTLWLTGGAAPQDAARQARPAAALSA